MSRKRITNADVIVVGAGPAGSMTAYELAQAGANVIVLEEHNQVGSPCHCAGLISPRTLELAGIEPDRLALRSYSRARIWGPLESVAWLESNRTQVVAIDRPSLDGHLAARAEEAGARIWLDVRMETLERVNGGIRITAVNGRGVEHLRAPIVIGADGALSNVARCLNGKTNNDMMNAVKAEVRFTNGGTNNIEVFVGNEIAPGWFGWVIPLDDGYARLGLGGSTRDIGKCFEAFLNLVRDRFGAFEVLSRRGWLIPFKPSDHIAFDNGLLVGDAARQSKPSSGGGIYMGMRAGVLAAQVALEALSRGDPSYRTMQCYEKTWLEEEGDELRYNYWLRSIFNSMSDAEIDGLVALCSRSWARPLISRLGDIDFVSRLFRPIHMALETVGPRLLRRLGDRLQHSSIESLEEDLDSLELDPEALLKGIER